MRPDQNRGGPPHYYTWKGNEGKAHRLQPLGHLSLPQHQPLHRRVQVEGPHSVSSEETRGKLACRQVLLHHPVGLFALTRLVDMARADALELLGETEKAVELEDRHT